MEQTFNAIVKEIQQAQVQLLKIKAQADMLQSVNGMIGASGTVPSAQQVQALNTSAALLSDVMQKSADQVMAAAVQAIGLLAAGAH